MTATTTPHYSKPLPKIEPEARPYWQYLKEHRLHVQRCARCAVYLFPPGVFCPRCLSAELVWTPVSGRGTVYAWVTMHRAYLPAYEPEVPYNVSLVELDEGVRLWTNVVGCAPSEVRCGMRVEVVYEDVTSEITLAKFRPVG
jgi:uncharacterized OB-fold protein